MRDINGTFALILPIVKKKNVKTVQMIILKRYYPSKDPKEKNRVKSIA